MKNLNKFLDEKKEEDKKKPHLVKDGEGKNDKKFIKLMGEYKKLRRDPDKMKEAKAKLKAAQTLKDVSADAKVAAAYL